MQVSIDNIVREICKSMDLDYNTRVVYDSSFADGQFKKTVSNARLLEALRRTGRGDYQFVQLSQGIPEVVQWFTDNYAVARK